MFQSLIGILVDFNVLLTLIDKKGVVSIPDRDFSWFQLEEFKQQRKLLVSIPDRDFSWFQRHTA